MQLSQRQQQTIAASLTIIAGLVIITALFVFFVGLSVFVRTFSDVLLPPAVAAVAALIVQPYYDWLHSSRRIPRSVSIVLVFLSILIPVGIFVGFFGMLIVEQIQELVGQIPVWWNQLVTSFEKHWPDVRDFLDKNPLSQKIVHAMRGQGPLFATGLEFFASTSLAAGTSVATWVAAFLSWVVTPVYFAFFVISRWKTVNGLENYLPFLKEGTRNDVVFLAREFVHILVAFFRGQIVIAILQGLLLAIGFSIAGLEYGLLLGFLLGFLNVIPYLGSILGIAITLPLAYFQEGGGLVTLTSVLVVFLIVQMVEGYYLTPKIMGGRTGLHPMMIIFAIFFWGTALGGIMGMILAIPLTAFLVVFWRLAKEKYITELV